MKVKWSASTIFYGTVRTAKEFATILVDIDSKLVSIQKVVDNGTDIGAVFDRATQSAETFGQSISKALDAYIEFARQGYKGAELGTLADAGLVASNVGEISSQSASEYLTASLVQWKKETSEAMGIIDSWNNVSNNYATTVEKLAQGQSRAGATAKAMGLDFDQLNAIIGTVTASTKQSGSEIGNFVKNVLPRLISDPAQDALKMVNVSLTDKQGNLRDIVQVYTDVANKVKELNDTERISVMEGLAG
ncbi:phage tail tape measure protein [Lysinibacillus sp. NPDC086135]|uniref:phage tail tape measure protein n=1 Tax=Lysinibacillus sp. NPDC086135 TaxID=3364130 RepID=UPI003816E82C